MGLLDWFAEALGFDAPSVMELIFITCAVVGATFFIVMMALMLIGDILGGAVDSAFDTDFSMDTDLSFELFSLQGIAAAIMMFGLMGLFTLSATGMELLAVLSGGFAAGGSLYMVRVMMQGITNLQADGTMKYSDAIGQKGQVYSRVRENKTGEVQVSVDGTLRTLEARAKDKTLLIPSGELIRVIDVIGSTLIVEPLHSGDEITTEEE
jgi:membrane protein implicated in regulation of membrane protease activity